MVPSQGLAGRTILITRPRMQALEMIESVKQRGGRPLIFPVIAITDPESWDACDRVLDRMQDFDAVAFTSVNAVSGFLKRAIDRGNGGKTLAGKSVYAVGEATAKNLHNAGIDIVETPAAYSGTDLGKFLAEKQPKGARFLLPQGNIARRELGEWLVAAGASVETVTVYRTVEVIPAGTDALVSLLENGAVDVVTFASPSAVNGFFRATKAEHLFEGNRSLLIAVIGATTAEEVRQRGLPVSIVARTSTTEGLIEAISDHYLDNKH